MSADLGCSYCGFPLARAVGRARGEVSHEPRYCCYGCRFAAAASGSDESGGSATLVLAKLGVALFLTLNVVMFSMVLWASDVYGPGPTGTVTEFDRVLSGLWRWLCALLSLPVLWLLGGPMLGQAWQGLRDGRGALDGLLLAGIGAAYLFSWAAVLRDEGAIYFEVGCVVLVLVTLGRWLEAKGRSQATAALAGLEKLVPASAQRRVAAGFEPVPLTLIRPGDVLLVPAGARVPTDGIVLDQPATLDEHLFTGESTPRVREPGEPVLGGTTSVDAPLLLEVTRTAQQSTLQRYMELVRSAMMVPNRWQRRAERVSRWFFPAVLLAAGGAGAWHTVHVDLEHGVLTALAVLLIACPCALGIATPLAVWLALGKLAKRQVLLRDPDGLEKLAESQALVFDKTGTLTTGTATVVAEACGSGEPVDEIRQVAAPLAAVSQHPVAAALLAHLGPELAGGILVEPRVIPGRGVKAQACGRWREVCLGNPRFMEEAELAWPEELQRAQTGTDFRGRTLCCLGWEGRVRAVFSLEETLRPEAEATLAQLRERVGYVEVLTGDQEARAAWIRERLGVPVRGEQLPDEKAKRLLEIRGEVGPAAMIGDGLNDVPALAAAHVSMAMGCGADLTRDTASICLLGNDLSVLPWLVDLARSSTGIIRQNLFWAMIYNGLGVGLAVTGWLNPVWAALAMVASSASVVGNSLRLTRMEMTSASGVVAGGGSEC
ncbi:MAG TPA: cation-translocating P-type ATPase [Gemmatales bacterium]|nr:cation-translocating P-type ATPase [Gemmatales bacterium]